MMRACGLAFMLTLMLAVGAAIPATAQSFRDADYEALLRQARALATIEPTDDESRQLMRATAVTLADRLKRFIIAETEERADDKVSAPPEASLRPGEGAVEESATPGEREEIDEIPNPWFARYVTVARGDLRDLIALLDGGSTSAADLMLKADSVELHLRDLARPPE